MSGNRPQPQQPQGPTATVYAEVHAVFHSPVQYYDLEKKKVVKVSEFHLTRSCTYVIQGVNNDTAVCNFIDPHSNQCWVFDWKSIASLTTVKSVITEARIQN